MSSGIIGKQRLSRYLQAYGTIWESFYVIRNYWNAACVSMFTSICKDMGSFYVIRNSWIAAFVSVFVRLRESFHVIRNYWNAAFVSRFTSICKDMGLIVYHQELLEGSVCLNIYKHM